ncbi:uncharacterized protein LOC125068286 [Vanessa atalanta]|uniref:uncharacterized protein LOC125068286 n=1 Tax=Vanessa atalanta TaxID=42275 RepID=UPI001FCCD7E2|nr:uncharacterized protein LOC125068286 [Vanessa atalanta]
MTEYFNSIESSSASSSRKLSKLKGKKKSIGTWSKTGSESFSIESRLSMYSMDTRAGLVPKSSNSKENTSSRAPRRGEAAAGEQAALAKALKKTPSVRRMMPVVDTQIRTLVESQPCTSNHMSPDGSPLSTPKSPKTSRSRKATSPRKTLQNNNKPLMYSSPRNVTYKKIINSPRPKRESNSRESENTTEPSRNILTNDSTSVVNKTEIRDVKRDEKEMAWSLDVNANSEEQVARDEKTNETEKRCEKDRNKVPDSGPASVEVTKLLRQLCGGDATGCRNERMMGAKNAQLFCVTGSSPRQPSTPQLLRILEETIQKKTPKALFPKTVVPVKDAERLRMSFNIPERVTENLFQYRTKFVQHMLTSTMYANSDIGKPWEKIGSVSEQIIDELLLNCAKEMELYHYVKSFYENETR